MKISKLKIKKFRSIDSIEIWMANINAIVGANNTGKSCLLRALNAFFNYEQEERSFVDGAHRYTLTSTPKIEIHFDEIITGEISSKYIDGSEVQVEVAFSISGNLVNRKIRYKKGGNWIEDENILAEVKNKFEYILIPPNRDAESLRRYENSVLNQLLNEKIRAATENRDNYTGKFQTAIDYLDTHALKNISTDISDEFPIDRKFEIEVKYAKAIDLRDFVADVDVFIKESDQRHHLYECGSGIQSLTIISMYNLLGKLKNENIVIGLEEPETNLHPQAQKDLIDYFKKLVTNGNIRQFIFTTHSGVMVDQVDHTDIILFSKIKDPTRGFKSIAKRLRKDFFDKYSLDQFKYYQYFRYRNSDFFFAKHIVITESKSEIQVIHRIGEKTNVKYDSNGVVFLNLDGVDKAKYAIYLFKGIGLPFTLIVDKDFFCDYSNIEFSKSLTNGLPNYKSEFKDADLIKDLIANQQHRESLLQNINRNHTEILNLLEEYSIVCMRYSLELDLVSIESARNKYFDILQMPTSNRTTENLTIGSKSAIKKIANIITVFDSIERRNWPYSYSRIKKVLDIVHQAIKDSDF